MRNDTLIREPETTVRDREAPPAEELLAPRRPLLGRMVAFATVLVLLVVAAVAAIVLTDSDTGTPAEDVVETVDETLPTVDPAEYWSIESLVERGVLPPETLLPVPPADHWTVESLVERGVLPAGTLLPAEPTYAEEEALLNHEQLPTDTADALYDDYADALLGNEPLPGEATSLYDAYARGLHVR